jgi:hypothetical protein
VILWVMAALAQTPTWDRAEGLQVREGYVLPAPATRKTMRTLVRDLAWAAPTGTVPPGLAETAASIGMRILVDGDVAVLFDAHPRGGALLALRLGPLPTDLVLQAPHPLSDENTGALVGSMFDLGGVRAACIATNHRADGRDADPSGLGRSWLSVMTQGLADGLPNAVFVQIHGFDPDTSPADAVLSPGDRFASLEAWSEALRHVAVGLRADDVRTGEEVPDLAALDNAQGRWLARHGRVFWHIELSAEMRKRLRKERRSRAHFRDELIRMAMSAAGA